ncbi:tRNA-dihydrouridine(47) synthase [NAD(P)(+)]-like isoform X2 [Mixophyes fleayi]|uniref:tRNA-dihydrouridine(47) synthase [NAD(P)(+)]-like isoform X2 n=1 Tax=Mixophyes fleayi TaxID=3061075 RepID=UPI003F4DCEEE
MADGDHQSNENGKVETGPDNPDRGVAAIKPQYLTTKVQFHEFIDCANKEDTEVTSYSEQCSDTGETEERSGVSAEPQAKKIRLDDSVGERDDQSETNDEDKQEKKRARGQNRSRPHVKFSHLEQQRLCPSITQGCASKCFFREKCKFLHDPEKYLSGKQEDIGPKCYLYETFGKCIYGITCRFARSHLSEDYKNLINEELVKQWEGKAAVKNSLDKHLQQQLRKKKVPFEKAEKFLKLFNKCHKSRSLEVKAEVSPAPQGGLVGCATAEAGDITVCANKVTTEGSVGLPASETSTESSPITPGAQLDRTRVTLGAVTDEDIIRIRPCEKKTLDFRNKLYLAPLTTCGNLPFRRICKRYGADITCGEMAMCTHLLQGKPSEWALMKRHHSEDLFGVQLEGAFPDTMTKCAELLNRTIDVDFVDINVGCPIDLVYNKGGGCGLMTRTRKFEEIVKGMNSVLDVPLTVKIRTGVQEKVNLAHKLIPQLREWGVSLVTLHGRSREQRYTKLADWEYINQCAKIADPLPLFGSGDILSYEDANRAMQTGVSGIMLARGALVKPWLFTEIKEQRHWDISSSERFDILREFTNYGLEHWGSDSQGVERSRRFMLEWLSFLCRYIPVGLLEHVPQKINERPPYYMGRDYMETLMASQNVTDWIKISEMLLGPVPLNFNFLPKHKANSYR